MVSQWILKACRASLPGARHLDVQQHLLGHLLAVGRGWTLEATHDAVVCHPCRAGFLDTRSTTPLDLIEMYVCCCSLRQLPGIGRTCLRGVSTTPSPTTITLLTNIRSRMPGTNEPNSAELYAPQRRRRPRRLVLRAWERRAAPRSGDGL